MHTISHTPRKHDRQAVGDAERADQPRELCTSNPEGVFELYHIDIDIPKEPSKQKLPGGTHENKHHLGREVAKFRGHALRLGLAAWRARFVRELFKSREWHV